MKYDRLIQLSSIPDSQIRECRILEQSEDSISFVVNDGLPKPKYHLVHESGLEIAKGIIAREQIDEQLSDIIECGFKNKSLTAMGEDVVYWTILECYAQHRPLVLSPDMIWVVITQYIAKQINSNPEAFRNKIVSHSGSIELVVESETDLLTEVTNWSAILDGFYEKIHNNTVNEITPAIVSDFSTTGVDERVSSIITLMDSVKSYFTYDVIHFICGIPSITLKGTPDDWHHLIDKCEILKEFGLGNWQKRLIPILKEFERAARGCPNEAFWKSIVVTVQDDDFSLEVGCLPDWKEMDGWCVSLFPLIDYNGKWHYDKCNNTDHRDSEISRVGFKYTRMYPDLSTESFPMELWSGVVGVSEDEKTYALTPQIGWFVRRSHEHDETIGRLVAAGSNGGLNINVKQGEGIPEILKELTTIERVNLNFEADVTIPDWLFDIDIDCIQFNGNMDNSLLCRLKSKFSKIDYDGNFCLCAK